ncbi:uncharacterized protein LOC129578614 isoform X2 [Sitodiplosis mosellana]|uniref:uncharacterized protein LOC129578614 isoform X2 n=1 Tax=Sitodiplosis mosellana TaxID=263140 RepID=UPI002445386B|nr:uncharacterized protein LOC129578614 isoform X2 [Sitodiplosis mosellana]
MHRFNKILVMVLVAFYMSHAANVPVEYTTDTMADVYDPTGSDETFDPQKDYADFKSSYEKFYKMPGPPFMMPPSLQQRPWQPIEEIEPEIAMETTNPSADDDNDTGDITTTIPPQTEQQTTIKLFAENVAMRSMNGIVKSTQRTNTLASYEQTAPNAELLMSKPALPFVPSIIDNQSDEDLVNETGNAAQQAPQVIFVQNDSNIHNESADYVNDEAIETNYSQPITSVPYSMDTTITSLPSSPVYISTRPPNSLQFSTSTLTSPVTLADDGPLAPAPAPAPLAGTQVVIPTQSMGKKSKKIEELPRVYKYSADEIVRKYLDDTFLRAPLATLINTAPEPLRKAKTLWKSALRPNTPIDIVLVAFNSSGVGVTYSFKNTRTMIAGLDSVQESREMIEGGSGFYGILRASELVPYDSAIFISTDKIPQDISLMKNAATILLKKRIRLFLIWFGDQEVDDNETSTGGALGEVALRSGGEILRVTEESLGNGDMGLVTHFLQNDIQGAQVLEIPVNATDTNLHIKIQGTVDQATLITPIGDKLTSSKELMLRNRRSEQLSEAHDDDVVWPEYQTDNQFDEQQFETNGTDFIQERSGRNILQSITKIDLGAQSQLLANPGQTVQIHYEVTNLRNVPTFHNFQVVDEQRFLRSLNPGSMWVQPGQSNNAIVTCYIPPNIEIGTKDKITFTSQGANMASQSATLTVTSPQAHTLDRYAPYIYWRYGSRCYGRTDAGRCADSTWSLDITTIDHDTGFLRLQSIPKGIWIRDRYTAGTTQEVKATYTASCCTPRVSITSYDLTGNQKTITLDVTEFYLEPMEIVAIVLGTLLLLVIIIAIIWAIVYCCKKHRTTRELPVYRSRAERDRAT